MPVWDRIEREQAERRKKERRVAALNEIAVLIAAREHYKPVIRSEA